MDGFVRRIWTDKVDRVGSPGNGVLIIRFQTMMIRDEILKGGFVFFDKQPIIMKKWNSELSLQKGDIKQVLIWVHLENLELKY